MLRVVQLQEAPVRDVHRYTRMDVSTYGNYSAGRPSSAFFEIGQASRNFSEVWMTVPHPVAPLPHGHV